MRKTLLFAAVAIFLMAGGGCRKENIEKFKAGMADEGAPEVAVSILFDNSLSYKTYVEETTKHVKWLFQYLAATHPEAKVSLVLLDSEAKGVFNGRAEDLQKPYDELVATLRNGRSSFTDISGGVERAAYYLSKEKARRKIMIIFSDMKASTPSFHPNDEPVVPPPPDFPWQKLKAGNIRTYAMFVPFEEWSQWADAVQANGDLISASLPEELKTAKVHEVVFPENN